MFFFKEGEVSLKTGSISLLQKDMKTCIKDIKVFYAKIYKPVFLRFD